MIQPLTGRLCGCPCPSLKADDIQLFTCKRDTLLRELLHQFVDNHIHRVFVVDKDDNPRVSAVITLTDVLRLVAGVW